MGKTYPIDWTVSDSWYLFLPICIRLPAAWFEHCFSVGILIGSPNTIWHLDHKLVHNLVAFRGKCLVFSESVSINMPICNVYYTLCTIWAYRSNIHISNKICSFRSISWINWINLLGYLLSNALQDALCFKWCHFRKRIFAREESLWTKGAFRRASNQLADLDHTT